MNHFFPCILLKTETQSIFFLKNNNVTQWLHHPFLYLISITLLFPLQPFWEHKKKNLSAMPVQCQGMQEYISKWKWKGNENTFLDFLCFQCSMWVIFMTNTKLQHTFCMALIHRYCPGNQETVTSLTEEMRGNHSRKRTRTKIPLPQASLWFYFAPIQANTCKMSADIFLSNSLGQNHKIIMQPFNTKKNNQKDISQNILI